ncbi:MAG: hypothetical protein U1F81_19400 [Verrucomicrobiaceae bacterium]
MNHLPFPVFRVIFGAYLAIHFGHLVPYADELFGMHGLLPDAALNPLHGLFPDPLAVWDIATGWCVALTMLSIALAAGWWPRACAVMLWFGATALFHRNNLTANPALAYLGLLLVLAALMPPDGKVPRSFRLCAWALLAAGYTFSGITKLDSASWQDGSALMRLMDTPLARDWPPRLWFLALPDWMGQALTWGTLALELLFVPLCLHPRTRKWAWFSMVALHLSILLLVDFADLTLGMLMVHLFVFDPRWMPAKPARLLRPLLCVAAPLMTSCQHDEAPLHRGRVPFRWMESAPSGHAPAFAPLGMHLPADAKASAMLKLPRPGDVIAFHMSHAEAQAHLRGGAVQKLPYEFFRYGHIALVVPHTHGFRLLQVAMSEPANADHGIDYLRDKSWSLFRPRQVDVAKLRAFTTHITQEKPARYDMAATFGLCNRGLRPQDLAQTSTRYTCATLVVAALRHAGCPLRVTRCGGVGDLITPGQVVRARIR